MPEMGLTPPPSPEVTSQMAPSATTGGGGLASLMGLLGGGPSGAAAGAAPVVDIADKVFAVEPFLTQLAQQAPALAPDVNNLLTQMKSRMGGAPAAVNGLMAPPAMPMAGNDGLMGVAMQVEMLLPPIGQADPTLAPQIQFFIAKMRDEVPKVVNAAQQPNANSPAPTDAMTQQMPTMV